MQILLFSRLDCVRRRMSMILLLYQFCFNVLCDMNIGTQNMEEFVSLVEKLHPH
jgi:hypothetical protein